MELNPYIYNREEGSLQCTVCGGFGNAVSSPFISYSEYIPAHGHKRGCTYAKEALERCTLPPAQPCEHNIEHQIAMRAAAAEKPNEADLRSLLERLDPEKYKNLRSFVLFHAGHESMMFLDRVSEFWSGEFRKKHKHDHL